ncbi:DUF1801 domain-containing protein [Portibacter marinus]|uniref:DUF1801 domain-containing protein n=1 Tax=Portibacter marinus TaxID=2898660 RepID=UPI001F33B8B5|nr:DUF1801 domain-containing protein [Portibacter marinus]
MKAFNVHSDPGVKEKFQGYPEKVKPRMETLRNLILETAFENERIDHVLETLKWGEPSYLVKKGTTIRIDWKDKYPDQLGMFFQCTSKIIPTVKKVYGNTFKYDGSRAILLDLEKEIPRVELKECVALALDYHLLKDKPLMGI